MGMNMKQLAIIFLSDWLFIRRGDTNASRNAELLLFVIVNVMYTVCVYVHICKVYTCTIIILS